MLRAALAAGLVTLAACASGLVEIGNWHGVSCSFETPNSVIVRDDGSGLHVVTSSYTLDVVAGRLTLDGVDHGAVQAGDALHVTRDGLLFVNSVPRLPGGAR